MLEYLIMLLRGWKTVIYWENDIYIHRSHCWSDALEWASQYPQNARVYIIRHETIMAVR